MYYSHYGSHQQLLLRSLKTKIAAQGTSSCFISTTQSCASIEKHLELDAHDEMSDGKIYILGLLYFIALSV